MELVWTGPRRPGASSRDTSVVVRELFCQAERRVLVAGFVLYQGKSIFQSLAERMAARPELQVRMFFNIERDRQDQRPDAHVADELVREFAQRFRQTQWPGPRLPEVYYHPGALEPEASQRSSLHAKCVVVDDELAFISSANFTEAAQQRNIEAGCLIRDRNLAQALRAQFESLIATRELRRVV